MTGTNCDLFTHKLSRSYLNHLVYDNSKSMLNCNLNSHLMYEKNLNTGNSLKEI
jgi:hypothetical protein